MKYLILAFINIFKNNILLYFIIIKLYNLWFKNCLYMIYMIYNSILSKIINNL